MCIIKRYAINEIKCEEEEEKKKYSIRGERIFILKKRGNVSSHYIPITLFRNTSNLNRLNVGRKEMITCHGNPHSAAHAVTCLCTLTGHGRLGEHAFARIPGSLDFRPRCPPIARVSSRDGD